MTRGMKAKSYIGILIAGLMLSLTACQWKLSGTKSAADSTDVKVGRFDKLLDEYVSLNSFSALQKMHTEYPQETKILVEDVLMIGQVGEADLNARLRSYYADTTIQTLMKDALVKFEDMGPIEKRLTAGFKALKKEVPQLKVPKVYSQISALNQSVVVGENILGFSIDKYMGSDYALYHQFYYDYQCRSMEPSRIIPDCFMYYLISEYPFPWGWNRTLLDQMMHYGKMHWVIARLLDYDCVEDEIGYTKEEKAWCQKNKADVWNYMVQNHHLDETDPMVVRMYIRPAPSTACFGEDSPFELGVWLGTQIIEAYMHKHKEMTIAKLLEETDYRKMLVELQFKI